MNMLAQETRRRARDFFYTGGITRTAISKKVFIFEQGKKAQASRGHARGVLVVRCAYKTPGEHM
jgi:hypothetical protein